VVAGTYAGLYVLSCAEQDQEPVESQGPDMVLISPLESKRYLYHWARSSLHTHSDQEVVWSLVLAELLREDFFERLDISV